MHKIIYEKLFKNRRAFAGIIFAAVAFAVCCVWYKPYVGAVFAAMFAAAGLFIPEVNKKEMQYLLNWLWGIVVAAVTCIVSVAMTTTFAMVGISVGNAMLNMLCVLIVYVVFLFITARLKLSFAVASFLLVMLATFNGIIYQFRGKELGPMDFLSLKTAINVASQYKPVITAGMAYGWLAWLWVVFVQFLLPKTQGFPKIGTRLSAASAAMICVLVLWNGAAEIPIKTWASQGTEVNGYYLNFVLGIRDSLVEKPESYSSAEIEKYAESYRQSVASENKKKPNIIVIMDESYADLRVLGGELKTNRPVTPFLDSLSENTIKGYALTSVFGGNTANAEFEFLTGHSMQFLPNNSIPYQQYINENIFSLAWLMDSYGYKTFATHPFGADGWSRNRVYPRLGFEESTFVESYPKEEVVRCYIGDEEMFTYVLERLDEKEEDTPLFLFGVTIQNHGGYDFEGENFSKDIKLEGYEKDYPQAENYLSLINMTDSAMEYFLSELEKRDEDTVVLLFGDHFPYVEADLFAELNGGYFDTLQKQVKQYTVPFVIWANYDIPEKTVDCTSLKMLPKYLLETAGLDLPAYYRFMADMEKTIPAMNTQGFYSAEKGGFVSYSEATEEEKLWFEKYSNLQYNNLFDRGNRNGEFFGQYIGE